jgi:secreted PhoX family phosphatase
VKAAAAGVACSEGSTAWGTELTPENPEVTETVDVERGGAGKDGSLTDEAAAAAAAEDVL